MVAAAAATEEMPSDDRCEVKAELDLGPPPPELVEYAKREINEDPETRCQVISELRDMIYGEWSNAVVVNCVVCTHNVEPFNVEFERKCEN